MSETSTFLEPWAFVAQGVAGAAIERPFEGVLEDPAMDCFSPKRITLLRQ